MSVIRATDLYGDMKAKSGISFIIAKPELLLKVYYLTVPYPRVTASDIITFRAIFIKMILSMSGKTALKNIATEAGQRKVYAPIEKCILFVLAMECIYMTTMIIFCIAIITT